MCCGMTNYKKSRNQNDRCSLLVPFRIWNEIISRYQSQEKNSERFGKEENSKNIRQQGNFKNPYCKTKGIKKM